MQKQKKKMKKWTDLLNAIADILRTCFREFKIGKPRAKHFRAYLFCDETNCYSDIHPIDLRHRFLDMDNGAFFSKSCLPEECLGIIIDLCSELKLRCISLKQFSPLAM